jgi:prolyl oligopeptidase
MIRIARAPLLASIPLALACGPEAPAPVAPAAPPAPSSVPAATAGAASAASTSPYPATRTVDAADTVFGTTVRDPYRWLEDGKSDEVVAWANAQDGFARDRLAKLPGRDAIAKRLTELLYLERRGAPAKLGGRRFYDKKLATQEKGTVVVERGGTEKVLLDPNTWPEQDNPSLSGWFPSYDGRKVAYSVNLHNADDSTLHVIDVDTGKVSDVDVIPGTPYSGASWTPTSDGFYYRRSPVDPKLSGNDKSAAAEVVFHKLGADPKTDVVVHEKTGDPTRIVGGWISRDGHWLFSSIDFGASGSRNELYFRDARKSKGTGGWLPLAVGVDASFSVLAYRDRFYVTTTDGAPHGRVFVVDPRKPDRASWKELLAERPDQTLQGVDVVGGHLIASYLVDVVTHVEIRDLDGKLVREVAFPVPGSGGLGGQPDDDEAYVGFSSYTYPDEISSMSIKTGATKLWYRTPVPADMSRFTVEELFFQSKDGTRIPVFVVHAKDWKKDAGPSPLYLTGYGGFTVSLTPGFDTTMVPWLEHGGIVAVANLRGGGEYGDAWHRAGMLHKKQNVFDDFIGAAEFLIAQGFTDKAHLVAEGASNGGLLMGAITTQRPDLFRVVLCGVPLLDMIRYPKFGVAEFWVGEYGSPDVEDDFRALFAYSPYHHVTPGVSYPSFLMLSSESDDRVDPMHARKFTAELQTASTGGPVLLRLERNAGHGGAGKRKEWVDREADAFSFALSEIAKPGSTLQP